MKGIEIPTPYVFIIAVIIGCLVGLLNGLIITKVGINPIITTLGTLAIIRGVCYFWADLNPRVYNLFVQDFGRIYLGNVFPITTVYIIVAFAVLALILKFTRFGRDLFTIGGNETLARLAGIPVDRIKIISYMISGFFASIAGLLLISQLGSGRPEYGTGAELEVLTIVVLGGVVVGGGRGNLLGVFIALVIIQTISNGMVLLDVPVFLRMVVKGALLVLVIAIDAFSNRRHLRLY
jgi:ribose transport system permease protein